MAPGRDKNLGTKKKHISTSSRERQILQILMQVPDIGVHNTTRPT